MEFIQESIPQEKKKCCCKKANMESVLIGVLVPLAIILLIIIFILVFDYLKNKNMGSYNRTLS